MAEEIEYDIKNNNIYFSPRLSDNGKSLYVDLLKKCVIDGNDSTLASDLINNSCLLDYEIRKTQKGVTRARVPVTANTTLSEGEYNRYYIRALCLRVIGEGKGSLEIYRAKEVMSPRIESMQMIGKTIDPKKLLIDLRTNIGIDTVLGLPPGPNSGLSVRIKNE